MKKGKSLVAVIFLIVMLANQVCAAPISATPTSVAPISVAPISVAPISVAPISFTDVPQNAWAHDAIAYWADAKVLNGYKNGTFSPDKTLSRAELVKLMNSATLYLEAKASTQKVRSNLSEIVKLINQDHSQILLKDVGSNHWAQSQIQKAVAIGYIKGFGNGIFKPDAPVTQEQFAAMLGKVLGQAASYSNVNQAVVPPQIWRQVSVWAKADVLNLVRWGFITVEGDRGFKPQAPLTREMAAQVLYRCAMAVEKEVAELAKTVVLVPVEVGQGATAGLVPGAGMPPGSGSVQPPVPGNPSVPHDPQAPQLAPELREQLTNANRELKTSARAQMTTALQFQVTDLISSTIDTYLGNTQYDFKTPIERAKTLAKTMSEQEYNDFKRGITANILMRDLMAINSHFDVLKF